MTGLAWTIMILICGTVWGGFLLLLSYAFRREGIKSKNES